MTTASVIILVVALGAIAGLRAAIPPLVLTWAVHWGWLGSDHSIFAYFFESARVAWFVYFVTIVAIVEIAVDKNATTPTRIRGWPLISRIFLGGSSGAVLSEIGGVPLLVGAALGAIAAIFGAYGANKIRVLL